MKAALTAPPVGHLPLNDGTLERDLFDQFHRQLGGFTYLAVPSMVSRSTIERQGLIPWEKTFKVNDRVALAGSAEQGLYERFADTLVQAHSYWAHNQCFRNEDTYIPGVRLREFRKTELFGFASSKDEAMEEMARARAIVEHFLLHRVRLRRVYLTEPGPHKWKQDLECLTRDHGWLETHSLVYYGEEMTRRFGITGATHSWCATGLASPRILLPIRDFAEGLPPEE